MIRAIQGETERVVASMQGTSRQVGEGMGLTQKAVEGIVQIVGSVEEVSGMIQRIATAAEEQSTASEQIAGSVERITAVSKEAASGARRTETVSGDMVQVVSELKEMVGRFHVNGKMGG